MKNLTGFFPVVEKKKDTEKALIFSLFFQFLTRASLLFTKFKVSWVGGKDETASQFRKICYLFTQLLKSADFFEFSFIFKLNIRKIEHFLSIFGNSRTEMHLSSAMSKSSIQSEKHRSYCVVARSNLHSYESFALIARPFNR